MMTAPISVWLAGRPGRGEPVSMERGEDFIHLHGWQKPDVLKSFRELPVVIFNITAT